MAKTFEVFVASLIADAHPDVRAHVELTEGYGVKRKAIKAVYGLGSAGDGYGEIHSFKSREKAARFVAKTNSRGVQIDAVVAVPMYA